MAINFNTLYPWNSIKEVVIGDKYMVRIPKFYYKVGECPEGSDYAGKTGYWVSGKKEDGYELHPAFMRDGKEIPYFFIGAYETGSELKCAPNSTITPQVSKSSAISLSTSLNKTNSANPDERGWHLQNIYEQSAINMLIMIECGTPDINTTIAYGVATNNYSSNSTSGTSKAVWRGIHEWWGNNWESVDGIKTGPNSIVSIFDKEGKGTYVQTQVNLAATPGYITTLSCVDGALIPATTGTNNFGCYKWNDNSKNTNNIGFRGNNGDIKLSGLFSVAFDDSGSGYVWTGGDRALAFRLAKYPEF